jgi:GntR family transcriptional regulator, N-acetylglucosamine utilization regulator
MKLAEKSSPDKTENVALYIQIREALRSKIVGGELAPGDRLPAEEDLAAQFGVSRMTVRQGISDLADEGLVYRRQGVGTFVSQRHIERDHNRLTTFFDSARAEGFEPKIVVLKQEIAPARLMAAKALGLKEGEPVIFIRTLRLADGLPVTVQNEFIPYKLCPELLHEDLENRLAWEVFESYGGSVKHAVQKIEAVPAEDEVAGLLELDEGAPVLYKQRTFFAEDGTPVEFILCYNRGDRYSVTTTASR